jgi:hypothetical protein
MSTRIRSREQVNALDVGFISFEDRARAAYDEAQRAAALIPPKEFEEVFQAAPEMEFHHRYVQSILTWVWYEVNENHVRLEHLPYALQGFYKKYEEPFGAYWMA